MEHVILFEHVGFRGAHKHVFRAEPNLAAKAGGRFNDRTSAAWVLEGNWAFCRDSEFGGEYGRVLPPGRYAQLSEPGIDIPNDAISSLKAVGQATIPAPVPDGRVGHAVLFEHQNFRGHHRHVIVGEADLAGSVDDGFNDRMSSLVVLDGNWRFYRHVGLREPYDRVLGPALYSWVRASGAEIRNDDVSSLEPVADAATGSGLPLSGHVILFEEPDFEGYHRHVFWPERNLGDPEDRRLGGNVGSIAVLDGEWMLYRGPEFDDPHAKTVAPGLYPRLAEIGIPRGDITSLEILS